MGRVTLDGEIAQFSTGLETNPDLWDAKADIRCIKAHHHKFNFNTMLSEAIFI